MTVEQFTIGLVVFYLITNLAEFLFNWIITDTNEEVSNFAIIKFFMGFASMLILLFCSVLDFGVMIKNNNVSNFCYNSTVNFESYEIQDEYIYLHNSDDIQIYPLVAGAKIENGECTNE